MLWNPARWRTRDGYMPFRVFHVYETEIETYRAYDRISQVHARGLAGARTKEDPIPDELRREMARARLVALER